MSLNASWSSSLIALLFCFWAISSSSSWSIWRCILWTFISPYSALLSASWSTLELCHYHFIYRGWRKSFQITCWDGNLTWNESSLRIFRHEGLGHFIYTCNWNWNWGEIKILQRTLIWRLIMCKWHSFFRKLSVALNFSFWILLQTLRRSIKCLIWSFRVSSLWCAFSSLTCEFFCTIFALFVKLRSRSRLGEGQVRVRRVRRVRFGPELYPIFGFHHHPPGTFFLL